jgi:pyrimidine-nucleoside phosphorylase
VVDKHSTGGVGDKVSLILAPLAAACGLTVPMVSGRGLGHTGGTIDKLEAIPGFSADLDAAAFTRVLGDVGCAIIGATDKIAPADRRLYALRDVTGTVPSIPLIVASIMSKKLAEGLDGLVLDVKVGRAAFMTTLEDARELARRMIATGRAMGVRTAAMLTRMEEPLGLMVGNACEVEEAVDILEGRGPAELARLCLEQTALMVHLGLDIPLDDARLRVTTALDSGRGREVFGRMVHAQGGNLDALPQPREERVLRATRAGFVSDIDGYAIATTLVKMGAGRQKAGAPIDPRIGLRLVATRGDRVEVGDPLGLVLVGDRPVQDDHVEALAAAFAIADAPPAEVPSIYEVVGLESQSALSL